MHPQSHTRTCFKVSHPFHVYHWITSHCKKGWSRSACVHSLVWSTANSWAFSHRPTHTHKQTYIHWHRPGFRWRKQRGSSVMTIPHISCLFWQFILKAAVCVGVCAWRTLVKLSYLMRGPLLWLHLTGILRHLLWTHLPQGFQRLSSSAFTGNLRKTVGCRYTQTLLL